MSTCSQEGACSINTPQHRIGIDLGGTKIEGILLSPDGSIDNRIRLPTPREDYDAILSAILDLCQRLSPETSLPVGIGTPGSLSRVSPLMRNSNSTCLNGKPLLEDLQRKLNRPVRIANDADCFTLSEASDGAAAGVNITFGVILGTGVGGGLCINGRPVAGVNGITGEWGHNPQPFTDGPDRSCFCGRKNCVETWLCGSGLGLTHQTRTGEDYSAEKISGLAEKGDGEAMATMEQYADQLAAALSIVINIIDPDVVVLGGGLSNIDWLYQALPTRLTRTVFSDHIATRIVKAKHGDSSGVRGAAWLWPRVAG